MAKLIRFCCLTAAACMPTHANAQPSDGPASVSGLFIVSTPRSGDTYGFDEAITLEARFDQPVKLSGDLHLWLAIGANSKRATYRSCTSRSSDPAGACRWLWFSYSVEPFDNDADGISVATKALELGKGTMQDLAGNPVDLDLGQHAILNDRGHKVDGRISNGPPIAEG